MAANTTLTMPAELDRAGVIALNEADEFHRYELTPDGALIVTPPPDTHHGEIVVRLTFWLGARGVDLSLIQSQAGVNVGTGMRIPDLMLLRGPVPRVASLAPEKVTLVVEVVSPSTRTQDRTVKPAEYAGVGIAHYWLIERGETPVDSTVIMFGDPRDGRYQTRSEPVRLSTVLASDPAEHGLARP